MQKEDEHYAGEVGQSRQWESWNKKYATYAMNNWRKLMPNSSVRPVHENIDGIYSEEVEEARLKRN